MADEIEPIIHKMTEAIPDTAQQPVTHPEPERPGHDTGPLHNVDKKQHNAEVHPGHRERLVDIGRGQDTSGRGSQ